MAKMFFLFTAFMLLAVGSAAAQSSTPVPKRPSVPPPSVGSPGSSDQEGSRLPDEMRVRLEIARADADYKKVLEDADKLTTLSAEIAQVFHEKGKLAGDELKKVGTIEKLARRILTQAGGDLVDDKSEDFQHKPLNETIEQLNTDADRVQKSMKEQTRFVVSATVIGNANEIINLTHHIRRLLKAE